MTRYILYTRVSTAGQDDNYSHESQLKALQRHVADREGVIVAILRETASGGAFLARPKIQEALRMLEADEADVLLCFDISRYSRNVEHQQAMMRRVEAAGKQLEFATLDLKRDNDGALTPEARLMVGVGGTFEDYRKWKIRADTMRGAKQAAEKGIQPRRRSPYGYDVVTTRQVLAGKYPGDLLGKYVIVEAEAALVRELYQRRVAGESLEALAIWFDSQWGRVRKTRIGPSEISDMLARTVYKGEATFGRTRRVVDESRLEAGFKIAAHYKTRPDSEVVKIQVPPIVTEDVWEAVNALRGVPRGAMGETGSRYLLSSLLRCPRCGEVMIGWQIHGAGRTNAGRAYICRHARLASIRRAEKCSPRRIYPAARGDEQMLAVLRRMLDDPDYVRALLAQPATRQDNSGETAALQESLDDLVKQERLVIEAQMRAISAGADSGEYERILRDLTGKRRELQTKLEKLAGPKRRSGLASEERVQAQLESLRAALSHPDVLTPGSEQLSMVKRFLLANLDRVEFEEWVGRRNEPGGQYHIGPLRIYFR